MRRLALGLLLSIGLATSAHATVRINEDMGGRIHDYIEKFVDIRKSGERIEIDGPCLSACTLVLGIVPQNRVCVTGRAILGFHSARWIEANGQPGEQSEVGTQLLWEFYPPRIRKWINARGGLTPNMIFMRGTELATVYPRCR